MADPSSQTDATPSPSPKRRRWLRRLLVLGGVLLILIVLAPLAVALPFVRNLVADKIGEALNREVTIGGASAFWGKGVDLEDLVVSSPAGFDEPLATVKRLHVDVSVLSLLGGGLDADVRVEEPRVAFAKDASGRSNTDGLFGEEPEQGETAPPEPGAPASETDDKPFDAKIRLEIVDGHVRATLPSAKQAEELRDLDVLASVNGDGALSLRLTALAVGAAAQGGDAKLEIDVAVSAAHEGPVKIEIPEIDLSRLAGIVEGASGVEGLRGRFQLSANGQLEGEGRVTGQAHAQADGLALRMPSGLRFAAQKIRAEADVAKGEARTTGKVSVKVEHIELLDEAGEEVRRFREPLVELALVGHHDAPTKTIVVQSGRLTAGQAISATASKPWEIRMGDAPSAKGELVVQADLGRLTNLRSFVPALETIRGGRIGARVVAEAQEGLEIRTGIRIVGLELAPGDLSPSGYREKEIILQLKVVRDAGEGDVPTKFHLTNLTSSMAKWSRSMARPELVVSVSEAGVGAQGAGVLDLDMAAVGNAFGGALGLKAGERLGGSLRLQTVGVLEPNDGEVRFAISGRGLTVPPSWAAGVKPSAVDGVLAVKVSEGELAVDLSKCTLFGLGAKATARVNRAAETGGLEEASLRVTGDLANARPLLAPLLGLRGRAKLLGTLDAQADLVEEGGARTLKGSTTIAGLTWIDEEGQRMLEEPRLELKHDLTMSAGENTRYGFEQLALVSKALKARLEGSATTAEDGTHLDATLHLDGDASRLAGILRTVFGEEYKDLKGTGPIKGQVALRGGTADGMRSLLVDGKLKPGGWSAGGLTLTGADLVVKRAAVSEPLSLRFTGGVNGGRMDLGYGVRLGPAPNSWTLDLRMERVDTSPLLVDHGAGEYLAWFMPTLVPNDRQGQVLSGLLDAQIAMRAADLGDRLEATLTGDGEIRMDQGSIGESTLFRAVGGGGGLGNVGNLLVKAVPEVGQALAGLQRSTTFTKMESKFDVAKRVVNIRKGLLDGERTRIDFKGMVGFNEIVNLDVNLTFLGTAGKRLKKVISSETIPLKVTGKMDEPRVQPSIDSSKLAAGALEGLLPGDGKNPLDRLKDLIPR